MYCISYYILLINKAQQKNIKQTITNDTKIQKITVLLTVLLSNWWIYDICSA